MSGDPYSDPVTGALFNELGLSDAGGLEAAEREITHAALIWLVESPVAPTYDLHHLREIHGRIFGDIHEWAGQVRMVAIAKGAAFCLPQYIESSAAVIFDVLRDEGFLRGLNRQLARDAGYMLSWQHLDSARNIEASAASLRGDPEPLRRMLDALVSNGA